jgi:hypothetical protein
MNDLAERAVACKGWRWMRGMQTIDGAIVLAIYTDVLVDEDEGKVRYKDPSQILPDLTDPATFGCLLALVREALGDERAHCEYYDEHECWEVWMHEEDRAPLRISFGETEAEALVSALERKSFPRVTKIVTTPK